MKTESRLIQSLAAIAGELREWLPLALALSSAAQRVPYPWELERIQRRLRARQAPPATCGQPAGTSPDACTAAAYAGCEGIAC